MCNHDVDMKESVGFGSGFDVHESEKTPEYIFENLRGGAVLKEITTHTGGNSYVLNEKFEDNARKLFLEAMMPTVTRREVLDSAEDFSRYLPKKDAGELKRAAKWAFSAADALESKANDDLRDSGLLRDEESVYPGG
jgi:hypothetical protein